VTGEVGEVLGVGVFVESDALDELDAMTGDPGVDEL